MVCTSTAQREVGLGEEVAQYPSIRGLEHCCYSPVIFLLTVLDFQFFHLRQLRALMIAVVLLMV